MTRSSADPVRIAVVGVGHLGRHHARLLAALPEARLVGVHDHHEGRAEAVAREFGTKVLPDLAEVTETAEAVVVATPTVTHAEIAGRLLACGRDVLVEKPIAATVAEAEALLECARERGRILQVGHVERYNPAVQAALELVSRPGFVEVHRLGVFTPRSLDVDVVLDLMIHDLQIARELAGGPPTEVRASGVAVLTPRIDIANARISFEGGCVANLTASRVSSEKVRKFRIFAPSLYVSVDMQAQTVRALRLSRDGERPEIVPVEVPVHKEEPLARELADFVRAVRLRTAPLVPGELGRDALALAGEVVRAIEQHQQGLGEGVQ
jgi:predicted dehydrogenase